MPSLLRRCAAEFLGTAFLLLSVVGSGIMAVKLCGGNDGLALLANALATAGALFGLITVFAPLSGAHFNPVVTLLALIRRQTTLTDALAYISVQVIAAPCGVLLAHALFELPLIQESTTVRAGGAQFLSEVIAAFGLLLICSGCSVAGPRETGGAQAGRTGSPLTPLVVALWILAAYWFTSSTSFANPAVTIARSFTDTFAGIRPADVPLFLGAQLTALACAALLLPWLFRSGTD